MEGGRGDILRFDREHSAEILQDYRLNQGSKEWLYIEPSDLRYAYEWRGDDKDEDDDPRCPHGTAMTSKAIGGVHGVARKANLVMLRWPLPRIAAPVAIAQDRPFVMRSYIMDGINMISNHVQENNRQGKGASNHFSCSLWHSRWS